MRKILTVVILFILSSVNLAFASGNEQRSEANKKIISDSQSTQKSAKEIEDPDLKLSIEELKKKYPISLLDEKKKNYKEGQKINIDDYSIAEIKAAFLNVSKNSKNDEFEAVIIKESCEKLGWRYNSTTLTKKQKRIQFFIFSNHKIREHVSKFVSDNISFCLLDADPFGIEDRD